MLPHKSRPGNRYANIYRTITKPRLHLKRHNMKQDKTQQEVVLVTTTAFFKQHLHTTEASGTGRDASAEQLEEACWNGLLGDMLPELLLPAGGQPLFLWHIRRGPSFLKIGLGTLPPQLDECYSIDASFFLRAPLFN